MERVEGEVLDGRWGLGKCIGQGSFGAVFASRDLLTGDQVAIKQIHGLAHDEGSVREAVALRLLRVPGVVRLLDEFRLRGSSFLVMEHAEGSPFPGPSIGGESARTWPSIELTVRRLLGTLVRVHGAGLIHLDLKPGNVLVDDQGRPLILDLGLSAGRMFSPWDASERSGRGTPFYAAPEQLNGQGVDRRTDLFAVGVMVFEAIFGRPKAALESFTSPGLEIDFDRLIEGLEPRIAGVPKSAMKLCAALLASQPGQRPDTAEAALGLLQSGSLGQHALDHLAPSKQLAFDELRALFRGPDRLLHLQEDCAEELSQRTNGLAGRVRKELDRWVETGLADWDGTQYCVSRRDLGLLKGERSALQAQPAEGVEAVSFHCHVADTMEAGTPERLTRLVLAGRRLEAPREAMVCAAKYVEQGLINEAHVVLFQGVSILEDEGEDACGVRYLELFSLWIGLAAADNSEAQLLLIRQRLEALLPERPQLLFLDDLLGGALAGFGTDGARAVDKLERIGVLDDDGLEALRLGLIGTAARHLPGVEGDQVLTRNLPTMDPATTPGVRYQVHSLTGRKLYRQSRFVDSAFELERASQLAKAPVQALMMLVNAASSWLEAGHIERAMMTAQKARVEAAGLRSPILEGHATWLERTAAYRMGQHLNPDRELIEAAGLLGNAGFEAQICFHEGVLAWRAGELDLAKEAAKSARLAWRSRGQAGPWALARMLGHEAGDLIDAGEREELLTATATMSDPSLVAQMGCLLVRAGMKPLESWLTALASLEGSEERRWDIFSLGEMREGLAPVTTPDAAGE